MALKDWVQDSGTTLFYTDQAKSDSTYNDNTSPHANMIDGDFDTYSVLYLTGGGPVYYCGTIVAEFTKAVNLTQLNFKKWTRADGSFGVHGIWVYDGSWTNVYSATGNGSQTITVETLGEWTGITKIQFSLRSYANDPVAWTQEVRIYEVQAFGPIGGFACII